MSTTEFSVRRLTIASCAAIAVFSYAPAALMAQAPSTYFACYVPLTGTVYRIKQSNLKTACTTGHVEFSWTDGANAVRTTDPLSGDLSGVLSNANVVRLLGRALSSTPPQPGQVLTWNGTEWIATTPAQGSGGSIANWERVTAGSPAIPGQIGGLVDSNLVLTATCPTGKRVVAGGTSLATLATQFPFGTPASPNWMDAGQYFFIVESYPESNGSGWTVRWHLRAQVGNLPAGAFQVFAVCVTG